MTESQKIELRRSKVRERLGEIGKLSGDVYTDEIRTEESALQDEYTGLEQRHRTAIIAEDKALDSAKGEAGEGDAETRERVELRSKARLTEFLLSAARGRLASGAEAELQAAAGVTGIPIELWDVPQPQPQQRAGTEQRAVTPAPGTVGINLDPIRPAVFANSIAPRLGIEMPRVMSGTFASGTITGSQSAAALAKSGAAVGAVGAITVQTASPKRVSARLELTLEDIAAVGQANFESILRQNLSMALADALDDQMINGTGTAPNLAGLFQRLTDPTAAPTAVADFDAFVAAFAGGVDGLWSNTVQDVAIVAGVETYRLSAQTFRDIAAADLGADDVCKRLCHVGCTAAGGRIPGCRTRQPSCRWITSSKRFSTARAGAWKADRWGCARRYVRTGAKSRSMTCTAGARRRSGISPCTCLLGDVILVQPNAYAQVAFQVA